MNIQETFDVANAVSDKRNSVYNELITLIRTNVLPNFIKSCNNFGIKIVYFKFNTPVIKDQLPNKIEYENWYGIIIDCEYEYVYDATIVEGYDKYEYRTCGNALNIETLNLTKVTALTFVKALISRLDDYNKKYNLDSKIAEEFIKTIVV